MILYFYDLHGLLFTDLPVKITNDVDEMNGIFDDASKQQVGKFAHHVHFFVANKTNFETFFWNDQETIKKKSVNFFDWNSSVHGDKTLWTLF